MSRFGKFQYDTGNNLSVLKERMPSGRWRFRVVDYIHGTIATGSGRTRLEATVRGARAKLEIVRAKLK